MPHSRPAAKKRRRNHVPGFVPVAAAPPAAAPIEIILPSGIRIAAVTTSDAILVAIALISMAPRC